MKMTEMVTLHLVRGSGQSSVNAIVGVFSWTPRAHGDQFLTVAVIIKGRHATAGPRDP